MTKCIFKIHPERKKVPNPDVNAFGTVVSIQKDNTEIPVICLCGGSCWLCPECAIRIVEENRS